MKFPHRRQFLHLAAGAVALSMALFGLLGTGCSGDDKPTAAPGASATGGSASATVQTSPTAVSTVVRR